MANQISVQDVRDMFAATIPAGDIEQILVQAYNFTKEAAQSIIREARTTPIKNMWGATIPELNP